MSPADDAPAIAVVGMAGAFPGADSVDELWEQLRRGEEGISRFSPAELAAGGTPPDEASRPDHVPAKGMLSAADAFDAKFFGYSSREAVLLDPQHRVFLEAAHAALEDAGHDPWQDPRPVGVFAGSAANTYYHRLLARRPDLIGPVGELAVLIANDKDFLATRASYVLDLTGPSVAVQSACSTSLVAVCMACTSLAVYQCDLALAGGVAIRAPLRAGYRHVRGGILSPDGHCRPYDAMAAGTVPGDGVAVVVLKRLADAVADRDPIRAVVRGWAVNNDGNRKAGFAAPSLDRQAEVIDAALHLSGIDRRTLGLIEGHGTATPLGDAVELAALCRALGPAPAGGCALGSVKGNLGHLDAAAGVTGFIKAVLAVQLGEIPPSLHFRRFHPEAGDPARLYVPRETRRWEPPHPRRAGVSSFGIGGTNAHVVLEQAEVVPPARSAPGARRLQLSAATDKALRAMCDRLAEHLRRSPGIDLADVAHTLRGGRRALAVSREFICRDTDDAIWQLSGSPAAEPGLIPGPASPAGPAPRKVRLPTYPFDRQRHWVEPGGAGVGSPARRSDPRDWLYAPVWKPCPQPWSAEPPPGRYVVFLDPLGFGAALVEALRGPDRVVATVEPGDRFGRIAGDHFRVRPTEPADYRALFAGLAPGSLPLRVVYGWGVTGRPADPIGRAATEDSIGRGLLGPLYLARALGTNPEAPAQILLVTDGLDDVTGSDWVAPGKSVGIGPCRVIPQEYPHLWCRLSDVRADGPDCRATVARLIAEFGRPTAAEPVVAIRGGRRWVQGVEPVSLRAGNGPMRPGGVVLITGGLGGIGRTLAGWLARAYRPRIALVGRSARADDPGAAEVAAGGAEVMVLSADIADPAEATRALHEVRSRWGPIHGLIHAAGAAGGGSPGDGIIATRSARGIADTLRPKVAGTLALWEALDGQSPEWTVLCSSLGTWTGGIGGADYCAANAFLDGFAAAAPPGGPVIALGWDAWAAVGLAARQVPEPLGAVLRAATAHAMSPEEGSEVFGRILADPLPRVYVSTRDLLDSATRSCLLGGIASREELLRLARPGLPGRVRPGGDPAPVARTETVLTAIWGAVLGGEIGPHDNFFDLGGHSLLALEILNRVCAAFRVELPLSTLFEAPTVALLARRIDAARAGGEQGR